MSGRTRIAAGIACACALMLPARADEPYRARPLAELLPAGVSYDPSIPTPQSVTGFAVGDVVLPFELLVAYVRAVDAASDRVSVEEIGRTWLGRPILAVTVTSEENQARLPEIRAAQQSILDGEGDVPADQPAIIEVVHGVHGDETSGFDVAPLLLYHLAASEDAQTQAIRDEAVVTLIVTLNPDGAARAATWTNAHRAQVPVAYPQTDERREIFMSGRGNHYWFDLNRQWLPATQPESQAVVAWNQDWLPHVVADLHEMEGDSTYFFSPGPRAGLHPLLTDESFELGRAISSDVAQAADEEGRLYVTEEYFDDYYLGYGSSYPGLLGAVAFTYEQSGIGGLVYDGPDGLQRYDDKIAEHFRSVMAMIDGSVARRPELLDYQQRYFADQREAAADDPVKAYLFASDDRARLRRFLELLADHRIEAHILARDVEAHGVTFAAGEAFVVALDQPRYALAKGLLEVREPEGKTDFYDITGWTMTMAYGLDHAELDGRLDQGLLGAVASPESVAREAAPPESPYAYVLEWGSRYAPRTAYRLLDAGLLVKVLPEPARIRTEAGTVDVPTASLVVPVEDQPLDAAAIHALMTRAALEDDVSVHAATSGLTPSGTDLGGFDLATLDAPRVLLVTGRGVTADEAGEVWRLLDAEMSIPVAMVDAEDLDPSILADFSHVILVDGSHDSLPDDFAAELGAWMDAGGVLVATRGGAVWASVSGLASARLLDPLPKAPRGSAAYVDRFRLAAESSIGGAIFGIALDPTHPIAYGYDSGASFVHRSGETAFAAPSGYQAVAWYPPDALASGYASEENLDRLAGAAAVFAERRGDGAAVLFADDPLFRGYWLASEKLVLNALFFARSISPE